MSHVVGSVTHAPYQMVWRGRGYDGPLHCMGSQRAWDRGRWGMTAVGGCRRRFDDATSQRPSFLHRVRRHGRPCSAHGMEVRDTGSPRASSRVMMPHDAVVAFFWKPVVIQWLLGLGGTHDLQGHGPNGSLGLQAKPPVPVQVQTRDHAPRDVCASDREDHPRDGTKKLVLSCSSRSETTTFQVRCVIQQAKNRVVLSGRGAMRLRAA